MATTANVNMMAGVKFMLLGTELNAGFEQTDSGKHIFVFQDLSTPNEGVTVDQLVSDVKTLMGKKATDITIPTTGDAAVEYAFRLDVIATGLIPAEIKLINVERITIAVWNTTSEKVKKQLAISIDSAK